MRKTSDLQRPLWRLNEFPFVISNCNLTCITPKKPSSSFLNLYYKSAPQGAHYLWGGSKPLSLTDPSSPLSIKSTAQAFLLLSFSVATITATDTLASYRHLLTTVGSMLKHSCPSINSSCSETSDWQPEPSKKHELQFLNNVAQDSLTSP